MQKKLLKSKSKKGSLALFTPKDFNSNVCCLPKPFSNAHLAHNSSFVAPKKPQISAPVKGIPKRLEFKIDTVPHRKLFQSAALSPDQCATYDPDPGNVDLQSIYPRCKSPASPITLQ